MQQRAFSERFGKTAVLTILLLGIIATLFIAYNNSSTPATAEQVSNVLEEQGLPAWNTTGDYRDMWSVGSVLETAVSTERDDIRFDFFIFDSKSTASSFYERFYAYINEERYSPVGVEYSSGYGTNRTYLYTGSGLYNVCIQVDNTIVFAYCNEENTGIINTILQDIGYLGDA